MRDLRNGFSPLSLPPLPPGPTGTPVGPGSFDRRPLDLLLVSPHIPAKPVGRGMRYRARVEGGTEPRSVRSCCSSLECARPLTSRLALRVHPTQCCRFVSRFLSILDLAWVENRGEFRWLRQCSQIGTGETAETGQLWGSSCPTIEAPDGIRIRQFGIQAARSQVGSRGSGRVCACPWFCRGRLRGSQALGGSAEQAWRAMQRASQTVGNGVGRGVAPRASSGQLPDQDLAHPPTSDLPSGTDLHTAGSARLLEQIGLSVPTHFLGRFHPVLVTFRPKLLLAE